MTTWYSTLEIEKDDKPTGKYRKVEHNTSMTRAHSMCDHEHDTKEEADECPVVVEKLERIFPTFVACPTCKTMVRKEQLSNTEGLKTIYVNGKEVLHFADTISYAVIVEAAGMDIYKIPLVAGAGRVMGPGVQIEVYEGMSFTVTYGVEHG